MRAASGDRAVVYLDRVERFMNDALQRSTIAEAFEEPLLD
jgi:hypothetical protein